MTALMEVDVRSRMCRMEYIDIGASNLRTSRIGLVPGPSAAGCGAAPTSVKRSQRFMARWSVAYLYRHRADYGFGQSEEIIGKALAEGGLRPKVQIATKVGLAWKDGKPYRDSSPARIRGDRRLVAPASNGCH